MSDDKFASPVEARRKAMDYLARREHTRGELLGKLTGFGFDPDIADAALAQLANEGLQSDQRFVDAFIQARVNQGKGPVRIRGELRQRGVGDELIEAGLETAGQDWLALARQVHQKKFGTRQAEGYAEKARRMRFLESRGFDHGHIRAAVSADEDSA